jgi:hypothetical protein
LATGSEAFASLIFPEIVPAWAGAIASIPNATNKVMDILVTVISPK